MSPPVLITFAVAPLWLALVYVATWIGGLAVFELETPIFFVFLAFWLAQYDVMRVRGAAARDGVRFPHPHTAAFGSAPWGSIVAAQLLSVLGFSLLASTTSNDEVQFVLIAAGLLLSFPASWLLEWRLGRRERTAGSPRPA